MMKKTLFLIFVFLSNNLLAQNNLHFAGHFIDREGRVDLVSRFNGKLFEIEVTKDGAFRSGLATFKDEMLVGYFKENKDSVYFTLKYFGEELILKTNDYYLALLNTTDTDHDLPAAKTLANKKKELVVPYPTGQRVFFTTAYAFNLPDESWEYSDEKDYINLKNSTFKGFFKIVPHQISTLGYAKTQFSISDLFPGKYEQTSAIFDYGKRGVFRTYSGYDAENQKITFHIITLVGLDGGGAHIICGARQNYFKSEQCEILAKMIANSFEIL